MNKTLRHISLLLLGFCIFIFVSKLPISANTSQKNLAKLYVGKTTLKELLEQFGVSNLLNEEKVKKSYSSDDEKQLKLHKNMFKASYLEQSGDKEKSVEELIKLDNSLGGNIYIKIKIAEIYKNSGNTDKAFAAVEEALKIKPDNVEALLLKALILQDTNNSSGAAKCYEDVLKIQPENLRALESQLDYYFRDKADLDKTVEIGNKIILIDQRNLYTYLILASTYALKSDMKNAITNVDKVIRFRPDLIWRIMQIGEVLQNNNQINDSYMLFRHLFVKNPGNNEIKQKFEQTFYYKLIRNKVISLDDLTTAPKPTLELKFNEQTINEYNSIIKENPGSLELKEVLAKKYYESQKPEEAKKIAEDIIKVSPNNYSAFVLLGQIAFSEDKLDEALQYFQKVIDQSPEEPEIYSMVSKIYQKQKNPEKTEKLLKNAILMHADNEKFYRLLANFYRSEERIDDAIYYYEKADEVDPESFEAIQALMTIYMQEQKDESLQNYIPKIENRKVLGKTENLRLAAANLLNYRKFDLAKRLFEKLLASNETDLNAISALAEIYNKNHDYAQAVKIYENIKDKITDDEGIKKYNLYLAETYFEQKNKDKAIQLLKDIQIKYPDDFNIYYSLIHMLNKNMNFADSNYYINEASKNIKEEHLVNELKALALVNQKKNSDALPIYEKLSEEFPGNDMYYYAMAAIYFDNKDFSKAEEFYRKAMAISPMNPDTLNNLGYMFIEQGKNLDEAKELIEKAKILKPYAGYILDSLGWLYFKKGDLKNAQKYLEKSYRLSDEDYELCEHLSQLYEKLGDAVKAKQFKEKSIELKKKKDAEN